MSSKMEIDSVATDKRSGSESPPPSYDQGQAAVNSSQAVVPQVHFDPALQQTPRTILPPPTPPPFPSSPKQKKKKSTSPRTPWFKNPTTSVNEKKQVTVVTGKPRDDTQNIVAMVVDRSGSMGSMAGEVHSGCNTFFEQQLKSDTEDEATSTVIFTRFDNEVDLLYDGIDLPSMPPITPEDVAARGSTALYDAIGDTLVRVAEKVNKMDVAPSVVIFILTDGQENASKVWNKKDIQTQIKRLQEDDIKWEFYFAAANQDGMKEGSALSMKAEQCSTFQMSPGKMRSAFASSQQAYSRGKRGLMSSYTPLERGEMN